MVSESRAKFERLQGYQERSSSTKNSLYTIKDLEKLNASCGNCKYRGKLVCIIKKNKPIKMYNICTHWKDDAAIKD